MDTEDQKLQIAKAISKAITGDQNTSNSSTAIFLEKFYKKNSSDKNKLNEVRLSRFNTLIYKFNKALNNGLIVQEDLTVYFLSLFAFICKPTNLASQSEDRMRVLTASYFWIAKNIEAMVGKITSNGWAFVTQFFELLLVKDKKWNQLRQQQFVATLKLSQFFKVTELSMEEEVLANRAQSTDIFIEQQELAIAILKHCDINQIFCNLIKQPNQDPVKTIDLYLLAANKMHIRPKFLNFRNTILKNIHIANQQIRENTVKKLRKLLESNQFQCNGIAQLKNCIQQIEHNINQTELKQVNAKTLSQLLSRTKKIESLREIIKKGVSGKIEEFVYLFQHNLEPSYLLLQLILKSNQPIPKSKLYQLFQIPRITNRRGVIISLLFSQQKKPLVSQLLKLYSQIKEPTKEDRLATLQLLHFSLQSHQNQCQLFTRILTTVPPHDLNKLCTFQFLPYQHPLIKHKFQKFQKPIITNLLHSNDYQLTQKLSKVKIDLLGIVGESNPLLSQIETINKLTNKKKQQLIESLLLAPDDLLEIILMRINNLLEEKYIDEINQKVIDWCVKTYNKELLKYKKIAKEYLSTINADAVSNFIISVKLYHNSRRKCQLQLDAIFSPFLDYTPWPRLKDQNYSNYLIQQNKNSLLDSTKRFQLRLSQLFTFLKYLDEKQSNKKEVKKILELYSNPTVYLLQCLHYYIQQYSKKFIDNNKTILLKILQNLEPNVQNLENAERKAAQLEVQVVQIDTMFDFLLKNCYQEAITFIWKLMKSKGPKEQKNKKKKPKNLKKQSDLPERILLGVLDSLNLLLVHPQRLKDLTQIIEIIQKILNQQEQDLSQPVLEWMQQLHLFRCQTYSELFSFIKNIRNLWQKCGKLLKIKPIQLQAQYIFISNLFATAREFQRKGIITKPQFQTLQTQLFFIIFRVYSSQEFMQIQASTGIPVNRLRNVLFPIKLPQQISYFYCETCGKNVCEICASVEHRLHEKNYVLREKGSCGNHSSNIPQQQDLKKIMNPNFASKEQLKQYMRYEDLSELNSQRQQLKKLMIKYPEQRLNIQESLNNNIFLNLSNNPNSNQPNAINFHNIFSRPAINNLIQPIRKISQDSMSQQSLAQIRSTSDKSLTEIPINPAHLQNCDLYEQSLSYAVSVYPQYPSHCINLTSMTKYLIQSIQDFPLESVTQKNNSSSNNNFLDKFFQNLNNPNPQYSVTIDVQTDRFTLWKFNLNNRNSYQGYQRRSRYPITRSAIVTNGKMVCVIGNSTVTLISESKLRKTIKKRQKVKNYNIAEQQNPFNTPANIITVPFQVTCCCFSANTSIFAIVGPNQFQIYIIQAETKFSRKANYHLNLGNDYLLKFEFLPESANFILAMTLKELRIYELSAESAPRALLKFSISQKQLKDFVCNKISRTQYQIFLCDSEGSLFYEKFSLNLERNIQMNNKINLPQHKDILTNLHCNKAICIVNFRDGSNFITKHSEGKIQKCFNLRLAKLAQPNSDIQLTLERIGGCMYNVRQLYSSKECLVIACCLKKQSQRGGMGNSNNTSGSFAIIQISGLNLINVLLLNDNGKTDCFEVLRYEDQVGASPDKFVILGNHAEGTIFFKIYQLKKNFLIGRNTSSSFEMILSEQKVAQYNKLIQDKNILPYIIPKPFRCFDFKEHTKILFAPVSTQNPFKFNFKTYSFLTGVVIKFNQIIAPLNKLKITIFNQTYQYHQVKPQKQIQIALTIKQSLMTFLNKFIEFSIQPFNHPIVQLHGESYDKPSPYVDSYKKIVKILVNTFAFTKSDNYFSNGFRTDFHNTFIQTSSKLFKEAFLSQSESNLIYKIELLLQIVHSKDFIRQVTPKYLQQLINKFKDLFLIQKQYLKTTARRFLKGLFNLYRTLNTNVILGDPYHYSTFKDILYFESYFKTFCQNKNIVTFDLLLQLIQKTIQKRLPNLYLILNLMPTMIWSICEYFKAQIQAQQSAQSISKNRLNFRIGVIIRLLSEYYQFNKNRQQFNTSLKNNKCQIQVLELFQILLGGMVNKKDLYNELIFRSVEQLQQLPCTQKKMQYQFGCDLYNMKLDEQEYSNSISAYTNKLKQDSQPKSQVQHQMESEQPEEQYKQLEQSQSDMRIQQQFDDQNSSYLMQSEVILSKPILLAQNQQNLIKSNISVNFIKKVEQHKGITLIVKNYKDIIYELIIFLLQNQQLVNQNNLSYYVGMVFNLLTLLDARIVKYENNIQKKKIQIIAKLLQERLNDGNCPYFFMVFAYFVEPDYYKLKTHPSLDATFKKNIARLIIQYYSDEQNLNFPTHLFLKQRYPNQKQKKSTLKMALLGNEIDGLSHRYQIKYLSNLFMTLYTQGFEMPDIINLDEKIQVSLMKGYVVSKMRVLKNIITLLQIDKIDIEITALEVGFEEIELGEFQTGLTRILEVIVKEEGEDKNINKKLSQFLSVKGNRCIEKLESMLESEDGQKQAGKILIIMQKFISHL